MSAGLASTIDINQFVNVLVTIDRLAALYRTFGMGLVMGSTPGVIDVNERYRFYSGLSGVQQDFGVDASETRAATIYFSQSPQPNGLYVGRLAQAATRGHLRGATLSTVQQLLGNFQVQNGALTIAFDGAPAVNIAGIDLSNTLKPCACRRATCSTTATA